MDPPPAASTPAWRSRRPTCASDATASLTLSAPGALGTEYDFTGEHELLALSVKSVAGKLHVLKDPERSMLEGRIVLANPAAGRLFGFRPLAVDGRPLLEVVRNHALHEAVSAALATAQPQRLETKSSDRPSSGGRQAASAVQTPEATSASTSPGLTQRHSAPSCRSCSASASPLPP